MTWYYILGAYVVLINIVAFCFYFIDKRKARKGAWRIPESTLILQAFIGGSIGALLGMYLLRHKTQHIKFQICVPLAFFLHIALVVGYFYFF